MIKLKKEIPLSHSEGIVLNRPKEKLLHYFKKNWTLYMFLIPAIILLFVFHYLPLYGIQIAFKDYTPALGFAGSPWKGFKHFERFLNSAKFWPVLINTLKISITSLVLTFPIPIIFAVFLNQMRHLKYKKLVQTVTYIPYFISTVVLVGMINIFLSPSNGVVNAVIKMLGNESIAFMQEPSCFLPIYIISAIWQGTGWASIIYIAALTSVPVELHESAIVDGASKLRRIWSIDLPYIAPTIIIQLILSIGGIMNVGFEKVFLMQNDLNMGVSEVISTYVYKVGIIQHQYSFSSAVGLFNSLINFILLFSVNRICRRYSETSLF